MANSDFQSWLSTISHQVEYRLQQIIDNIDAPLQLQETMRYALLSRGKRLRPAMLMAVAQPSSDTAAAIDTACALECIHCYSLVHDDLPCMDNANTRRGQPSCHKAHGEAMAMLAADCLQPLAFEIITNNNRSPLHTVAIVKLLAQSSGGEGMGGGQALDLQAQASSEPELKRMHDMKTGALFNCAVQLGLLCQGKATTKTQQNQLGRFASAFGLLFQIANDINDANIDRSENKTTYVTILGKEKAVQRAHKTYNDALKAIADDYPMLTAITHFVWRNIK